MVACPTDALCLAFSRIGMCRELKSSISAEIRDNIYHTLQGWEGWSDDNIVIAVAEHATVRITDTATETTFPQ